MQTTQNNCIGSCFQLDNKYHIGMKGFEKIHWLPVSERFNQYLCSDAFKFFTGQNQANTRSSVLKLKHPVRNTYSGQKNLSYLTLMVWNSLPTELNLSNLLNNFKHKLKDHFFKKLRNMEQDTFACWRRIRNLNVNIFN